ncbi:hypothetical protein MKZ38_001609 [Zalerion maritima]|uniref:Uncharacterized protein n=1 Tax=Zalerion maritima TaxID=339359 RepID=A0AAD5RQ62_9PEZI|nr:hypothetical protein MKZ38_001609 [Zalerion maritima]
MHASNVLIYCIETNVALDVRLIGPLHTRIAERLGPQDRPNNWDTDLDEEELPEILARYQRYLEIFKRVLEEEEEKMRSEDSGAMWLHMMLSWGFNHRQLRHHIGDEKWDQLEEPFFETEEMVKFAEQKMAQKEQYEQDLERTKADMVDVDNQKMTAEEFKCDCIPFLEFETNSSIENCSARYVNTCDYTIEQQLTSHRQEMLSPRIGSPPQPVQMEKFRAIILAPL